MELVEIVNQIDTRKNPSFLRTPGHTEITKMTLVSQTSEYPEGEKALAKFQALTQNSKFRK